MTDTSALDFTRRDLVKGGAAAAVGLAATTLPLARLAPPTRQTVTGIVFEDRSRAGRGRPAIRGSPACWCPTGGRSRRPMPTAAIRCRSKRRWSFSSSSRPATRCRSTRSNLPRFFYIHQPKGSPADLNLHFRGIEPTGPLPASVDFALRKVEEPIELRRPLVHRSAAGERCRGRASSAMTSSTP